MATGKGMTERNERHSIDGKSDEGNAELKVFLETLSDEFGRPWTIHGQMIEGIRIRYDEVLSEALEQYPEIKVEEGGASWAEFNLRSNAREKAFFKPHDSEGWYLRYLVKLITSVEDHVKHGRIWNAASESLDIGLLVKELNLWEHWNDYAIHGEKTLPGILQARKENRKGEQKDRYDQVLELQSQGKNLTACFNLVAEREGSAPDTIKKDYYKFKKLVG